MIDKLLLTDAEINKAVKGVRYYGQTQVANSWLRDRGIAKAQLAEVFKRLKGALAQSRKGEDIDLPEEWFELFSSIQNDGITNVCANCDTPLLREGELYQKLEEAKKQERERITGFIEGKCAGTESFFLAPKGYFRFDIKHTDWRTLKGD